MEKPMCDMGPGGGGGGVTIVIVAPKGMAGGPAMPPGKGLGGKPIDLGGGPPDLGGPGGMTLDDPEDLKDLGADEDKELAGPAPKPRPMNMRAMGAPKKIAPKPRGL